VAAHTRCLLLLLLLLWLMLMAVSGCLLLC
jgi:hypothetical protein